MRSECRSATLSSSAPYRCLSSSFEPRKVRQLRTSPSRCLYAAARRSSSEPLSPSAPSVAERSSHRKGSSSGCATARVAPCDGSMGSHVSAAMGSASSLASSGSPPARHTRRRAWTCTWRGLKVWQSSRLAKPWQARSDSASAPFCGPQRSKSTSAATKAATCTLALPTAARCESPSGRCSSAVAEALSKPSVAAEVTSASESGGGDAPSSCVAASSAPSCCCSHTRQPSGPRRGRPPSAASSAGSSAARAPSVRSSSVRAGRVIGGSPSGASATKATSASHSGAAASASGTSSGRTSSCR